LESEHMFATLLRVSGGALSSLVGQGSVLAKERVLPAPDPLASLLPGSGVRRGGLVGIWGSGGTTLALSLLAEPVAQGSWAAVVGMPDLGIEAAAAMGVDLARVALVPRPGPAWPAVVAVLLDSLDLVVVEAPGRCRPADARRLGARAREHGSVLCVVGRPGGWPEAPELTLTAETEEWEGLGIGSGTLRARRARIVVAGRRGAGRSVVTTCWLPGPDGRLTVRHLGRRRLSPERAEPQEPEVVSCAG
jgi:hypothetical protein